MSHKAVPRHPVLPTDPLRELSRSGDGGGNPIHDRAAASGNASVSSSYFSWADRNGADFTTPARDQGQCGSCFVFSTLGATEAQFAIALGEPRYDVDFSEQDVIGCIESGSCADGGYPQTVAEYLRVTGAVDEQCSPYSATQTSCGSGLCSDYASRTTTIAYWDATETVPSETELKAMLLAGPLVTTMQVYDDFNAYGSGVYARTSGATVEGWHAITLIGWDDTDHSWIAKNSWGSDWGQDGFFKMSRQADCAADYSSGTCFAKTAVTFAVEPRQAPAFACVTPGWLDVTVNEGGAPREQLVTVENCGERSGTFEASAWQGSPNLGVEDGSFNLAAGSTRHLGIKVDPDDFEDGDYAYAAVTTASGVAWLGVEIHVVPAPPVTPAFSANVTSGEAPLSVSFSNTTQGSASGYFWRFGDGGNSDEATPTYVYAVPGTYTVKLTAHGAGGDEVKTRTDYITVLEPAAPATDEEDGSSLVSSSSCAAAMPAAWVVMALALLRKRRR